MPINISANKIKSKAQVDALQQSGLITAAQAKKLLAGLKPPKAKSTDANVKTAKSAAKAAIAPKGDKAPAGYIVLDKSVVDNSFLSPNKSEAGSRLHAFAKIKSSVDALSSYLPMDNELPTKHRDLVKTVKTVAEGAQNFMAKQQSLVEAQHYSFPAQIWSPGDVGFHPRELEARLEKALKPFGVTLAQLPNVLREAAQTISSNEAGHHNPRLRMLHVANEFERLGNNPAFQAAKSYTPVFRVEDREGSWQMKMTAAKDGMEKLEIVLRPGTPAPSASAKTPAWVADKLEKLDFGPWNPTLPAGFSSAPEITQRPAPAADVAPAPARSAMRPERALDLGKSLQNISDPNRVPRNISLDDIQQAITALREGAVDVARRAQGTRGNSVGWGGETVSASQLNGLANQLELLAMKMGGAPSFDGTILKPERALAIYQDVKGITDANHVPRHISRADVENASITIQRAAPQVRDQAANTRGSQVGWGGELMSFARMIDMAGDLATLALKMKQAGY